MNSAATRSIANLVAPALRRAASTAAAAPAAQAEGFQMVHVLLVIPPTLAIFGYGGTVCYHQTGALQRIRRSFAEIPH